MTQKIRAGLALIGILLLSNVAAGSDLQSAHAETFKSLRVGQRVTLKEALFGAEISLLGDGKIGSHIVVELGANHILLEDIVRITQIWIPITSIRSITWIKLPVEVSR